jgi:hypothetical protein
MDDAMTGTGWKTRVGLAALAAMTAGSAWAQDTRGAKLTAARVFGDAALPVKAIMAGLVLAAVASVVIWATQLVRRTEPDAGAVAFLRALGPAGPLFGLAAAAYTLLACCLGLVNTGHAPDFALLAPGYAEAVMAVMLGLLAGAMATLMRGLLLGRGEAVVA